MEFLFYSLFIFGIFFIFMSLITKTKNLISSIYFKVMPFFAGVNCIVVALYNLGIIEITFKN